ncbi:hypothetical protein BCV71DRAFT_81337 [Rhizopus microsporus]|uniref:Uncharacterized protein n=1 Tax=Rhizopus microsporus TaxID=58291 RepID=A0A1X0S8G7_RHIZD|nr:hypothetical protein BCV71DRAFT_81337 [Rhizopus microsporus]
MENHSCFKKTSSIHGSKSPILHTFFVIHFVNYLYNSLFILIYKDTYQSVVFSFISLISFINVGLVG